MNPLFPDESDEPENKNSYILPAGKGRQVEPPSGSSSKKNNESPAVEMIRRKVDSLYKDEPDVREELAEAADSAKPKSKHQQFMYSLSTSGKSLAEIQTAWHKYYTELPDNEKHEVWQEFYQANSAGSSQFSKFIQGHGSGTHQPAGTPPPPMPHHTEHASAKATVFASEHTGEPTPKTVGKRFTAARQSASEIKKRVLSRVRSRTKAQIKAKQHLQSLAIGLGLGALSILIFLFGFFNERFIIPFIQPSGRVGATPIILSTDGVAPSSTPELIIPKINVQLPVVYGLTSMLEADIQRGLEEGVIHYPNTAVPGQQGNAAYFGHSSNNIFNKGKYKFAFVLLHEMVPGDIFYLTYDNKVYSYRVFDKKVVAPDETWVLGPVADKTATAALITCDPPGTSKNRLVVWGEQISPNPNANAAAPTPVETAPAELPSEGPSAWSRFWGWVNPFN